MRYRREGGQERGVKGGREGKKEEEGDRATVLWVLRTKWSQVLEATEKSRKALEENECGMDWNKPRQRCPCVRHSTEAAENPTSKGQENRGCGVHNKPHVGRPVSKDQMSPHLGTG